MLTTYNNNTLRCFLLILSVMIYLPIIFFGKQQPILFNPTTTTTINNNNYFILPQQKQKQKQTTHPPPKLLSSSLVDEQQQQDQEEGGGGGGGAMTITSNDMKKKKLRRQRQQQQQQQQPSSSSNNQQPLLSVDSSKSSPAASASDPLPSVHDALLASPSLVIHDAADDDATSSSSIPPLDNDKDDDELWWKVTTKSSKALADDIDLDVINTTTTCGSYKCFYQSKSHPNHGYLIGQDRRSPIKLMKAYKMKKTNPDNPYLAKPEISYSLQTYELTIRLEQEYGIRHLCLSPPILISKLEECSSAESNNNNKLISILNMGFVSDFQKQNRTIDNKYFRCPTDETAKTNNNDATPLSQLRDDTIFIQVVKKAPEHHFLITPTIHRRTIFMVPGARDFFKYQIKLNSTNFRKNLLNDWNITRSAWLDTPELLQDFQFLLDYEGKIWQIDLDRIHNTQFDNNAKSVWSKNDNWQKDNATLYQLGQLEKQIIKPLIEQTIKYEKNPKVLGQKKKKKNHKNRSQEQDGEEGDGDGNTFSIIASDDVTNNNNNNNNNNDSTKKKEVVDRGNKTTTTTTTTTNSPPDDDDNNVDEWWKHTTKSSKTLLEDINDLDAINRTTTCGFWKCYYPSKTHLGRYGYVIGQDRRKSSTMLKAIEENKLPEIALENTQKSYNLAKRLQKQYGIRHLMVSPPIPIENCSIELANVLNIGFVSYSTSTTKNHMKAEIPEWYRYYRDANYPKVDPNEHNPIYDTRDNTLVIQVMEQAPAPNLLIRTSRLAIFDRHGAKDFFDHPKVIVNDTFKENLLRDWNSTRLAWLDTPQLSLDYQFLLDYQGRIWQIDIDRIYGDADPNAIVWSTTTNMVNDSLSEDNSTSFKLDRIEDLIINRIMSYRVSRKKQKQQKAPPPPKRN